MDYRQYDPTADGLPFQAELDENQRLKDKAYNNGNKKLLDQFQKKRLTILKKRDKSIFEQHN